MPNIPAKSNRKWKPCFSKTLYRERNQVERFFSKLKHFRRIATRYDKLAENFLAMVKLASVRRWLRAYESTAEAPAIISKSTGLLAAIIQPAKTSRHRGCEGAV